MMSVFGVHRYCNDTVRWTMIYLTNTPVDYIFTCVCTVIDHRWCHVACKEQKVWDETKSSGVTVVLYMLWRLRWSIAVHTHGKMLSICFIQ